MKHSNTMRGENELTKIQLHELCEAISNHPEAKQHQLDGVEYLLNAFTQADLLEFHKELFGKDFQINDFHS